MVNVFCGSEPVDETELGENDLNNFWQRQSGVSSTQALVAILIVGVVVAVIFAPRLLGQSGKALQAQASNEIEKIGIALDTYARDNGDYPSTEQGLIALWESPEVAPLPIDWQGPYLDNPIINDPWGNPYVYVRPGLRDPNGYDLVSLGSDGIEGGTGEGADVVSWIRTDE